MDSYSLGNLERRTRICDVCGSERGSSHPPYCPRFPFDREDQARAIEAYGDAKAELARPSVERRLKDLEGDYAELEDGYELAWREVGRLRACVTVLQRERDRWQTLFVAAVLIPLVAGLITFVVCDIFGGKS